MADILEFTHEITKETQGAYSDSQLAEVLSADPLWRGSDGRVPRIKAEPRLRPASPGERDREAAEIAGRLTPDGVDGRASDAAAAKLGGDGTIAQDNPATPSDGKEPTTGPELKAWLKGEGVEIPKGVRVPELKKLYNETLAKKTTEATTTPPEGDGEVPAGTDEESGTGTTDA